MPKELMESGNVRLDDYGNYRLLRCPRCGGNNLHQDRVTIYDRDEDEDLMTVTDVLDGMVSSHLRPSTKENPSGRRHGLTISFWCEGCTNNYPKPVIQLCIAQHKGDTLVSWRFTPIEPPKA